MGHLKIVKESKMKKITLASIVFLLCAFLLTPAWSLTIDLNEVDASGNPVYTDVGGLDSLYDWTNLGDSSDAEEINWINQALGWTDTQITWKYSVFETVDWTVTREDANYFAHDLGNTTDYFMLKIGTGGLPSGTPSHYLFDNAEDLQWAVIDVTVFGTGNNVNIGRVSHVTQFSDGGTPPGSNPVPEPTTMALLGIGLLGVAAAGRKKIKVNTILS